MRGAIESVGDGAVAALPIVAGYVPIGFAAGVLAVGAGMSPLEVGVLSLLVYAGSAQFVFANLYLGAPLALMTTVFLINFRHFLYSVSLMQKIKSLSWGRRTLIGAQLTDESFAVASAMCQRAPRQARGLVALNVTSYSAWMGGNVLGALFGQTVDVAALGADFMLITMFAALLMLDVINDRAWGKQAAVAVVAAALMVAVERWHSHPLNILAAAGAAAFFGLYLVRGELADDAAD